MVLGRYGGMGGRTLMSRSSQMFSRPGEARNSRSSVRRGIGSWGSLRVWRALR